MRRWAVKGTRFFYQGIGKPLFFLNNPEKIHRRVTTIGERAGKKTWWRNTARKFFDVSDPRLSQKVAGIVFSNPIGLAAGFDYEARLTQTLPAMGFGWQSIGTITARPCVGNASPQLGRLPKSKSLMVNKGFRNLGVKATLHKLERLPGFARPVGISIGQTNNPAVSTVRLAVEDIITSFRTLKYSAVPFSYYELNISCPNLAAKFTFYEVKNLRLLLGEIDKLQLAKPIFVKMPINENNKIIVRILNELTHHKVIKGVIIGNLQKDRTVSELVPEEVATFDCGNFSGKPTQKRSDELIALAYKNFGKKLIIIGCGGVFNAEDAYRKICLGASLVQMITGLIYEGPQVVAEINVGILKLLERDGYQHISEAIGSQNC